MAANPKRLSQDQMEAWLSRPDTRLFRQFLKDQRERLMEQWAAGQEMDLRHQSKALLLGEHADLKWSDYADFYSDFDGSLPSREQIDETESDPQ